MSEATGANAQASSAALDWQALAANLDEDGFALTPPLLDTGACRELRALFEDDARFRKTVIMDRHNFGRGRYRYFRDPLPERVQRLRQCLYPPLAAIANRWAGRLGAEPAWPDDLAGLQRQCRAAGQRQPTSLLLRYQSGDFNCLHQDLYGDVRFPLQVVIQLSDPGTEFDGGELVLVEQRPRMQSRPMVVNLAQGQAAILPVRERPRLGARGFHRTQMRHGVSQVHTGTRTTLGLIFHDAR